MKNILILFLLFSQLSFSQRKQQNYELYNLILAEQLQFGKDYQTDSIILIEKYIPKFPPNFEIALDFTADSISDWAIRDLWRQTGENNEFIQKVINNPNFRRALKEFTTDFQNHPKLKADLLGTDNVNIQTITSEKYYSFFGRKLERSEKGWDRIKKEYGTRHVLKFSKIKYYQNFATVYYEHHCGGLCGSGNIVVFEKKNGKWEIFSNINIWMA